MAFKPEYFPTKEIREELTCSICKETCKEPRNLPCGHSFCEACIDQHFLTTSQENRATCPLCRHPFILDYDGAKGLSQNLKIKNLVEIIGREDGYSAQTKDEAQNKCNVCDKGRNALNVCIKCRQNMCRKCTSIHDRLNDSDPTHIVKPIAEIGDFMRSMKTIEENMGCECRKSSKEFDRYCRNCNCVICQQCNMTKHEGHDIQDLTTAAKAAHEILKWLLVNMNAELDQRKVSIENIEGEKERVSSTIKDELEKVGKHTKRLHDEIERQESSLLHDLRTCDKKIETAVSSMCNQIAERGKSTEEKVMYIHYLQEYGNKGMVAYEACRLYAEWHSSKRFQVQDTPHYERYVKFKINAKYINMVRYDSFGYIDSQLEKSDNEKVEVDGRPLEDGAETTSTENNDHLYSMLKNDEAGVNGQDKNNKTLPVAEATLFTFAQTAKVSTLEDGSDDSISQCYSSVKECYREADAPVEKKEKSSASNLSRDLYDHGVQPHSTFPPPVPKRRNRIKSDNMKTVGFGEKREVPSDRQQTKSTRLFSLDNKASHNRLETNSSKEDFEIKEDGPGKESKKLSKTKSAWSSLNFGNPVEKNIKSSASNLSLELLTYPPPVPEGRKGSQLQNTNAAGPPVPPPRIRFHKDDLNSSCSKKTAKHEEYGNSSFLTDVEDENYNTAFQDQVTTASTSVTNQEEIRDACTCPLPGNENSKGGMTEGSVEGKGTKQKQKTPFNLFKSLSNPLPNLLPMNPFKGRET